MRIRIEYRDNRGGASQWTGVCHSEYTVYDFLIQPNGNLILMNEEGIRMIMSPIHWLSVEILEGHKEYSLP